MWFKNTDYRALNKIFVVSEVCGAKNRFAQFLHSGQSFCCKKPLHSIFALRPVFLLQKTASLNFCTPDSLFAAKNRFAQFLHSGQSFCSE